VNKSEFPVDGATRGVHLTVIVYLVLANKKGIAILLGTSLIFAPSVLIVEIGPEPKVLVLVALTLTISSKK
jgi:hypothetical protein